MSKTKYLTTVQFAKKLGVHPQTIRRWDKSGFLKPDHVLKGGHRYYTEEQVDIVLTRNGCITSNDYRK